jgi:hypothetical protein
VDGNAISVVPAAGRAVTIIERHGRKVAALVHDMALSENPALLDAVSSAAGLALENERLLAELRARLDKVKDSRARVVEASVSERRRLERNLHDGRSDGSSPSPSSCAWAQDTLHDVPHSRTSAALVANTKHGRHERAHDAVASPTRTVLVSAAAADAVSRSRGAECGSGVCAAPARSTRNEQTRSAAGAP